MSNEKYELGPRETILMLLESAEGYIKRNGDEEMRREVTEYRCELGSRLLDEAIDGSETLANPEENVDQ
jgi:hypothetical protein